MSSLRDVVFSPAGLSNRVYSVEEVDDAAFQATQSKLRVDEGGDFQDGGQAVINATIEPLHPTMPTKNRWTPFLVYCCFSALIGSTYMFGYNAVVINLPAATLKRFINDSYFDSYGTYPEKSVVEDLWTWTVSLFLVGGTIGGLIGGLESDKLGRKWGILLNAFIGVIGGVLMFMAPYCNLFELMMVGRFIAGVQCGSVTAIAPAFLTELAPLSLRGAAGSLNQLSIVIGGFSASVIALPVICGQEDRNIWPWMFFPCLFLPALQIVLILFTVESPRWLIYFRHDEENAFVSISRLREKHFSREVVQSEVIVLRTERETMEALPKLSLVQAFIGAMGWPLVVCVSQQFAQQLSGINAVIYYSTTVFEGIFPSPSTTPQYASLGVIGFTVVMTLISIFTVELLGRRALMIIGLGVMWLDCILIIIFMSFKGDAFSYLTIVTFFIFVGSFNFGPGPIPWFIAPELTLPQYRPVTIAICTFANWLANLANGLGFPPIEKALHELSFLPFLGLLTFFLIFTILFLPETRGLLAEESTRRLAHRKLQLKIPCLRGHASQSVDVAL